MSYLPRVKIVGTKVGALGGNTKCVKMMEFYDEKGNPIPPEPPEPPKPGPDPGPGPDPQAQLSILTPTETTGSTTLGSTLTGTPATFTGGEPPYVVKTRWESSVDNSPSGWAPLGDFSVDGPTTYTTVPSDSGRYLRFVTQGTDNIQTIATSFGDSVGPIGTVTSIGFLNITPFVVIGGQSQIITFYASITGDATPTYTWSIRSGPGTIISSTVGDSVEVQVNADAPYGFPIQVQVDAVDTSAFDNPQSDLSLIVVLF